MATKKIVSNHHLIFEGTELVGKSFLMSEIYNYLEKKYNSHPKILNGCHWFNCDVGVWGTPESQKIINSYLDILKILKNKNVLLEKFHLTDQVYHELYNNKKINYTSQEKILKKLGAKIILLTVKDKNIFMERIKDRLNLYPHYERILQQPEDYWQQQQLYEELIKKSKLNYLLIDSSKLPNDEIKEKILYWIGEKK